MNQKLNQLVINGRFELINRVGEGAFGEVYLAHDKKTDKKVAVKIESSV